MPTSPDITWALSAFRALAPGSTLTRAALYQLYLDYYEGRHKLTFATEKFKSAFGDTFQAMSENLCPIVVDSVADRLQVQGFTARNEADADRVALKTTEIERRNRMSRRRGEILRDALALGDNYVIAWPDPDDATQPTIYPNRPGSIAVDYHPEKIGLIRRAAKFWLMSVAVGDKTETFCRLNLYFSDRIERYITSAKSAALPEKAEAFVAYRDEADNRWPIPNPYGKVPVFAYANNAGVGQPGRSELSDVIPLQDSLNKSLCDLLVAMEFEAFAQRWVTGLEIQADENGQPIMPFKMGVDRMLGVLSKDTKFGEFSRADLEKFVSVQNASRASIARVAGLPLFMFMLGDSAAPPSGSSLIVASSRLTSKVLDRQTCFGSAEEDLMRFCLQIRGMSDVDVQVNWRDTSPKPEAGTIWDAATKKLQIVGTRQTLREENYTEAQIDTIQREKLDEEFGDGAPAAASDGDPTGEDQSAAAAEDAPEAETVESSAEEAPAVNADGAPDAGVVTDLALNGAQISSVLDVIERLSQKLILASVGTEVLVAAGLPRATAEQMASDSYGTAPAVPAAALVVPVA